MRYNSDYKSNSRVFSYILWFAGLALLVCATNLYSRHVDKDIAFSRWVSFINAISDNVAQYPYNAGLVVHDLKYDFSFSFQENEKFISASLIKLPIMCSVYMKCFENKLSLNTMLTLQKHNKVQGSGRLRYAKAGTAYSIRELVRLMIAESDNTAAKMLTEFIDIDDMNRTFTAMGLTSTNVSAKSFNMTRRHGRDESYTTPRDIAFLLRSIYAGTFLSKELCEEMIQLLKLPKGNNRLRRYLPETFELAHKTGLLRGACHDAGIVFTPRGDYLICVMTEKNRKYAAAKRFIAEIGKLAYEQI